MMILLQHLPALISGIGVTIILMLSSLVIGFVLASAMTVCKYLKIPILKRMIDIFIFLFRGTPLLVQIFLIYFGSGQFEWVRQSPLWFVLSEPMGCAIVALSLNTACYTTILLLGAIHSVPNNEIDACAAMGMSKWLAYRRVIFPRALRIALPAYSNEVIIILKSTSLASTITLMDIMGVTQQLIAQTYETVWFYMLAGVIYLMLNAVILSLLSPSSQPMVPLSHK